MYHAHFGLKEAPFSIKVNPSFLFMTQQHKDALATLLYGASSEGGFALLTGEIGTGKTTLIRALLQQLPDDVDIALVLNPTLNPSQLLATICDELKISYGKDEQDLKSLTDKLHHYLLEQHSKGRGVVVLIDEAQHLQFEALEQIRLLTNLETDTRKLMQIILVGQPELNDKLQQAELKQLAQRITARFHLGTLSQNEAQAYVQHRLQVAGLSPAQNLFPEPLVNRIHDKTEGVPRLINILCDRMLLGAYARRTSSLDDALLDTACKEVFGATNETADKNNKTKHTALNVLAAASMIAIALFAYMRGTSPTEAPIINSQHREQTEPIVADTAADTTSHIATDIQHAVSDTEASRVTGAEQKSPKNHWWAASFETEESALNALLLHQGIVDASTDTPCTEIENRGLACHQQKAEAWPEITDNNRIFVIQLLTPSRFHRYIPILGVSDNNAEVLLAKLDDSNPYQQQQLPLADVGTLWTGRTTLVWAAPVGFNRPVGLGSQGETVEWVAQRFAQLDQQKEALAGTIFTRALSERVKLFQREYGLKDDGIVGMQTAMKINDALNAHGELTLAHANEGGS